MSLARRNNGCYECYKRRIKCDKTEPQCLKCQKKGIICSGQGLRCRLSGYMNQRYRAESSDDDLLLGSSSRANQASSTRDRRRAYRWVDVEDRPNRDNDSRPEQLSHTQHVKNAVHAFRLGDIAPMGSKASHSIFSRNLSLLRPALNDSLNPQARMLFEHFATSIAPVMVVFDSESNGYRDFILPLACQDAVLERAVSVTAAFHLAQKTPELRHTAETGHHAIIEKLRRDSLGGTCAVFNQFTLATLLVLLSGETITGADNYRYLLEMLGCFAHTLDSMAVSPALNQFFREQIQMFQLFGFPLSNEIKGLQVLNRPEHYFEFMAYPNITPDSTHYRHLILIREAIRDACGLYRRRAEASLREDESLHLVEQLRQKVSELPLDVQGAHALVWVCFIAAAESTLPEHREFFVDRLRSLYSFTGFGSIPAALEALERLWAMRTPRRWTDIIATDIPVLAM